MNGISIHIYEYKFKNLGKGCMVWLSTCMNFHFFYLACGYLVSKEARKEVERRGVETYVQAWIDGVETVRTRGFHVCI